MVASIADPHSEHHTPPRVRQSGPSSPCADGADRDGDDDGDDDGVDPRAVGQQVRVRPLRDDDPPPTTAAAPSAASEGHDGDGDDSAEDATEILAHLLPDAAGVCRKQSGRATVVQVQGVGRDGSGPREAASVRQGRSGIRASAVDWDGRAGRLRERHRRWTAARLPLWWTPRATLRAAAGTPPPRPSPRDGRRRGRGGAGAFLPRCLATAVGGTRRTGGIGPGWSPQTRTRARGLRRGCGRGPRGSGGSLRRGRGLTSAAGRPRIRGRVLAGRPRETSRRARPRGPREGAGGAGRGRCRGTAAGGVDRRGMPREGREGRAGAARFSRGREVASETWPPRARPRPRSRGRGAARRGGAEGRKGARCGRGRGSSLRAVPRDGRTGHSGFCGRGRPDGRRLAHRGAGLGPAADVASVRDAPWGGVGGRGGVQRRL